jgi:hypothetical protein
MKSEVRAMNRIQTSLRAEWRAKVAVMRWVSHRIKSSLPNPQSGVPPSLKATDATGALRLPPQSERTPLADFRSKLR